jgi:hypothetical protein
MPYVMSSGIRIGETADAVLSDLDVGGTRDRRRDVQVRVRLVSERVLCVDDEPHAIISTVTENNTTRFLVDGCTKGIRNREWRARLRGLPSCWAAHTCFDGAGARRQCDPRST